MGLGVGVVVHAVYVAGFTDHYTFWAWYYASGVLAAALVASYVPQWFALWLKLARTDVAVRGLVVAATIVASLWKRCASVAQGLQSAGDRPDSRTYRLTNTGGQRSSVRG